MPRLDMKNKQAYDPFLSDRVRELDYNLVGVVPEYVPFTGEIHVTRKTILAVAADIGGFNAILPPLSRAALEGCVVDLFLVGASATAMQERRLKPSVGMTASWFGDDRRLEEGAKKHPVDLLVLAASQSEIGVKANAGAAFSGSYRALMGVQDLYGSFHPTLRMMSAGGGSQSFSKFNTICVTDQFSKELMVTVICSPRLVDEKVVVTGGPQFDRLVPMREEWKPRRERVRQGIHQDQCVVLLSGQPSGTAEMLMLLEGAAEKQMQGITVVVRQHSRSTELDQRLTRAVLRHLRQDGILNFHDVPLEIAPLNEDVLPGADLIISGYATANYAAILCGMPGVVYCGTPALRWDFWREKRLERPPEVEVGAGWWVENADDLARVITELRTTPESKAVQKIREAQARIAQYNDGHATDRVWAEMQKLLQ